MKATQRLGLVLGLGLMILLSGWAITPSRGQPAARPAWEYKSVVQQASAPLNDARLTELGQEGWDLVGFTCTPEGPGTAYASLHYIFKRSR